jgi:hypothetical protein
MYDEVMTACVTTALNGDRSTEGWGVPGRNTKMDLTTGEWSPIATAKCQGQAARDGPGKGHGAQKRDSEEVAEVLRVAYGHQSESA